LIFINLQNLFNNKQN